MSNLISLHNALRHRKPAQWPEFTQQQQKELVHVPCASSMLSRVWRFFLARINLQGGKE